MENVDFLAIPLGSQRLTRTQPRYMVAMLFPMCSRS